MEPPASDAPMLSVQEVARECGLADKTVRRAIKRGELTAYRLGSRYRVRREHLEQWIERCRDFLFDDDPPSPSGFAIAAPPVTGSGAALAEIERRILGCRARLA